MQNNPRSVIIVTFAAILAIVVVIVGIISVLNNPTSTPAVEEVDPVAREIKLQEQIAPLIKSGDMKACDQVLDEMYRKVCVNNIAIQKAEETNDISYCQYLDGELVSKEVCERQVVMTTAIAKEDVSACTLTTNELLQQECEDSYFYNLAQAKSDPSVCDQMEDEDKANQCWNIYHLNPSQLNLTTESFDCQVLRGEAEQTDCQNIIPIISTNPSGLAEACQNQQSQLFQSLCMRFSKASLLEVPILQ